MSSETVAYVAKYGDCLAKIAAEHNTTVAAIWSHPANAAHRTKRQSPDELYPGDVLHIPAVAPPLPVAPPELPLPQPPTTPPQSVPPPAHGTWPYVSPPPEFERSTPTWRCPEGICECDAHNHAAETRIHTVFLHDDFSRRMPGARCRVLDNGRPLAAPEYADAAGAIEVALPPRAKTIVIEWAPPTTPIAPTLPYRRRYHVELDESGVAEGVRQRLEHIGVCRGATLEEPVLAFQRAYGLPADGDVFSVAGALTSYHDTAMLPPLPAEQRADGDLVPTAPLPPDIRPPSQGCVSAVSDRDADCHFSFELLDDGTRPFASEPFVLAVGDGRVLRGTTDAEGRLEYGDVPAGDYLLMIGHVVMHVPAIRKEERWRPLLVRRDR